VFHLPTSLHLSQLLPFHASPTLLYFPSLCFFITTITFAIRY